MKTANLENKDLPAFACASENYQQDGLTKREYFIAMAMQGLCVGKKIGELKQGECVDVAEAAVLIADALIYEIDNPSPSHHMGDKI